VKYEGNPSHISSRLQSFRRLQASWYRSSSLIALTGAASVGDLFHIRVNLRCRLLTHNGHSVGIATQLNGLLTSFSKRRKHDQ
jgi:hypothetical protein